MLAQSSTVNSRCIRFRVNLVFWACLIVATTRMVYGQAPEDGGLRALPEHATIVSGEPLFLGLSITNVSNERLLIAMDAAWIQRVTTREDGRVTRWPIPRVPEEPMVFSIGVDPHETREITIAAVETAAFQEPGRYTMVVSIKAMHASATVHFVVLPYDASELRLRAEELLDRVIRLGDLEAAKGLVAMPSDVAGPYLCAGLKTNVGMLPLGVPKLEESGSPESIGCLIDLLPIYKDSYRLLVANALRRIERGTSSTLRLKIDAALASAK